MGWKISAIIINQKYDKKVTKITEDLGLGKSSVAAETTLNESLYPGSICIGFFEGKTILTHGAILMDFFNEEPSEMELRFSSLFQNTEILVLGQIEGAGISGFSYIKNGKRVRTKLTGEEEGEIINIGNELKLEKGIDDDDLPFVVPKLLTNVRLDTDDLLNTKMYALKIDK